METERWERVKRGRGDGEKADQKQSDGADSVSLQRVNVPSRTPLSYTSASTLSLNSNRLVNSCHAKCIQPNPMQHRYAEPELQKGEAVCIDRCTAKYFEVNKKIGERMQAMGAAAQAGGSFGR